VSKTIAVLCMALLFTVLLSCGCKKSNSSVIIPPGLPAKVSNPTPADTAIDVSMWTQLSWGTTAGAQSYDLYWGTVLNAVTNATTASGEYVGNQTERSHDPGLLACNTTYYWRVDSVGKKGATKGDTWSFTTPNTIYVDDATGDDTLNSGTTPASPLKTIQKGIDVAVEGAIVIVEPSAVYAGAGNRDLDFGGKDIWLVKSDYASPTAPMVSINCESTARAFNFHSGETRNSLVYGFGIANGYVSDCNGGSILCENSSSPTIRGCLITASTASG
jgi:hypothetical protein